MDTAQADRRPKKIVLVSGLSGAGKTAALKTLEDSGYFTIDNLPRSLLDPLLLLLQDSSEIVKVALGMDGRDPSFLDDAGEILDSLRTRRHDVFLLFMEASTEVLIRRFAETRRPHPFARDLPVAKGISKERKLVAALKRLATDVIDTSSFNIHQLRAVVTETIEKHCSRPFSLLVQSFGYKYGVPMDAAFLFDVRYLPNPYFVEGLRNKGGTETEVSDFVLADPDARMIVNKIVELVASVLPLCEEEGRSTLNVAIGCTGGQHRSVALAEETARLLKEQGKAPTVVHRDLPRAVKS